MSAVFSANLAKQLLEFTPKLIGFPLAKVPFSFKAKAISQLLGVLLAPQTQTDELDFLANKWVAICVEDLQLAFEVSFDGQWQVRPLTDAQVTFSANSAELILVAAAKEDPDSLFFQRKLSIQGDTELGLEVKNLLLSIEFASMPAPIRLSVEKLAAAIERLQIEAKPTSILSKSASF
ncbi:SCP2 sterol-binding domain-containing protein [Shewanella glacialipiscicola]|uniref:ubiquinone anaerobic biosynthesis accessory factor UbiT n=1 Tax=Shewanella glacialipiscicola TaxID=614069 RepID=UPI0021DA82DE|nr:SCP2 sterol-binding domain-containing protein [Shewanella glacialipiscicola]MCU7993874.1 SCP2 sterol-binding domain-containing protein [Shewanella glacialipiscicola]MCU8025192.1 SCP2 sterol-binding domain-containing protein [Shewanella glacialipiscicola]